MIKNKNITNIIFLLTFITYFITSAQERPKVFLTIYKNNLTVVKEIRRFDLKKGLHKYNISNLPNQIDPSSILIKPVKYVDDIQLIEKQYNYDVISGKSILEDNLDKECEIFVQGDKVFKGRLIKTTESEFILKDNLGNIILIEKNKIVNLTIPSKNENLLIKPELTFVVNSSIEKEVDFEVSYLTQNIGWKAKYIAFLQEDEKTIEIYPFSIINNRTGIIYENSEIKLISGEINRLNQQPVFKGRAMGMTLQKESADVPQFEEKEVFEYYSYTLDKKTDIYNNRIKEILLMPERKVNVEKKYIYDGARNGERVLVSFNFINTKLKGFGTAIPSGDIELFKVEDDNFLILLGQYQISDTPIGKEVNIQAGVVFDLKGERIQKEMIRISRTERKEVYQITIKNSKDTQEEITILEHPYGEWKIIKSTHEYIKKDLKNLEFKLQVNPHSEEILSYTIRYR